MNKDDRRTLILAVIAAVLWITYFTECLGH